MLGPEPKLGHTDFPSALDQSIDHPIALVAGREGASLEECKTLSGAGGLEPDVLAIGCIGALKVTGGTGVPKTNVLPRLADVLGLDAVPNAGMSHCMCADVLDSQLADLDMLDALGPTLDTPLLEACCSRCLRWALVRAKLASMLLMIAAKLIPGAQLICDWPSMVPMVSMPATTFDNSLRHVCTVLA